MNENLPMKIDEQLELKTIKKEIWKEYEIIPIIDYKAEESIEKRIKGETMKAEDKFKLQYHVDTTEKESRDESRDIEASDDKTSKGIITGDEEKEWNMQ